MKRRLGAIAASLAAALLPAAGWAQTWRITPTLGVEVDYSDNPAHVPDAAARGDWLTRITPAVRIDHAGSRATLFLDYRQDRIYHARDSGLDTKENRLASNLHVEVLEQLFFLDAVAGITQLNRSAFDAPVVVGAPSTQANRIETRTGTISPSLRGRFSDAAAWQVRLNETRVEAAGATTGSTDTTELVGSMRTLAPGARFGWSVDGTALRSKTEGTTSVEDQRARASLIYAPEPLTRISLYGGYESTDFTGGSRERGATPGMGFEWSPSPRTQVAGIVERRFFGTGHLLQLNHRTSRLALRVESRRDSTLLASATGTESAASLETLMRDLLVASIPDPLARAEQARQRLSTLGAAPTAIGTGLFTQRPFLLASLDASLAYIAPRDTLTLVASQRDRRAFGDAPANATDAFAQAGDIRTRAIGASWLHRLTRLTTLTVSLNQVRSRGLDTGDTLRSREDLATAFVTTQLGPRSTLTFGVRRVDFRSTINTEYTENAVFGTVSFRL